MAKKSDENEVTSTHADVGPGTGLAVVVTPHEVIPPERTPFAERIGGAVARGAQLAGRAVDITGKATASAARTTVETTGKAASRTAKSVTSAAKEATKAAKSAGKAIGHAAGSAAETSASAVTNVATSAVQTTSRVGATVATAASATVHFVGDLNGDGRFDAEDLRIAKEAIGKVAVELGGEAMELGKAAIRHPIVKDAAAAALVGGAVAAVIPFVGVPFGAAVGAATVLAPGAAGKIIDKTVSGASRVTDQARSASKTKRKPRAKSKS